MKSSRISQLGFGSLSGIIASNVFITEQAPTFKLGFGDDLGRVWLCGTSAAVMLYILRRENKIRDAGEKDDRYSLPEHELQTLVMITLHSALPTERCC